MNSVETAPPTFWVGNNLGAAIVKVAEEYPNAVLALADFYAWPLDKGTGKVHLIECPAPKHQHEWHDPDRKVKAFIVKALPEGMTICAPCAVKAFQRYEQSLAAIA